MPTPQIRADVAAAREGDDEAFERLVEATYSEIFTLAARLTQNHDDALDVVQEAYLRAYRGLIDFRGEARFSTWMHRITVNCATTLLTRRGRYRCDQIQQDVIDLNGEYQPERRLDASEISSEIRSALDDLPTNLRVVVVLRDVFDLTQTEIANQLGISVTAVKVRLHRGRKRMRLSVQASRENREPMVATGTSYKARHAV
tara:strand:+ start:168 stop:770 length:603 start_codon:yes stop_codon:yes gene_type:complete